MIIILLFILITHMLGYDTVFSLKSLGKYYRALVWVVKIIIKITIIIIMAIGKIKIKAKNEQHKERAIKAADELIDTAAQAVVVLTAVTGVSIVTNSSVIIAGAVAWYALKLAWTLLEIDEHLASIGNKLTFLDTHSILAIS